MRKLLRKSAVSRARALRDGRRTDGGPGARSSNPDGVPRPRGVGFSSTNRARATHDARPSRRNRPVDHRYLTLESEDIALRL